MRVDTPVSAAASSSSQPYRREIPLDDVIAKIEYSWFHIRMLVVCGVGFSAAAVEVVLSGFLITEVRRQWEVNEYTLALLPTIGSCGSIFGELFWGPFADLYGRRPAFLCTVVVVAVAGMLSASSPSIWWLIWWRALVGFGYGGSIAVDFAMFSEFMPTRHRTTFLLLMQLFWPVGQLLSTLLAWILIPSYGWRVYLFCCTIPTVFVGFLRPCFPESPRWLLLHNFKEEATEVVRNVTIQSGLQPEDVGLVEGTVLTLETKTLESRSLKGRANWMTLVESSLRSTTIGIIVFSMSLHVVTYGQSTLMPTLLEMSKLPKRGEYETMVLTSLAQFPGILGVGVLMYHFGQLVPLRMTMLFTALAIALFSTMRESSVALKLSCALVSMFLEAGWALIHTYAPEVYPTELRTTAIGATSAITSICTMGVPFIFASILTENESKSFMPVMYVLIVACLLGAVGACLFLHIETKDRDLDDRVKHIHD
jgi:putative MFS transporter